MKIQRIGRYWQIDFVLKDAIQLPADTESRVIHYWFNKYYGQYKDEPICKKKAFAILYLSSQSQFTHVMWLVLFDLYRWSFKNLNLSWINNNKSLFIVSTYWNLYIYCSYL